MLKIYQPTYAPTSGWVARWTQMSHLILIFEFRFSIFDFFDFGMGVVFQEHKKIGVINRY